MDGYVPLLNLISHIPAGNEIDAAGGKTYLLSGNSQEIVSRCLTRFKEAYKCTTSSESLVVRRKALGQPYQCSKFALKYLDAQYLTQHDCAPSESDECKPACGPNPTKNNIRRELFPHVNP